MSDNFESVSQSLRDEIMGDLAQEFFGLRKEIEDRSDHLRAYAGEVREALEAARQAGRVVHALLLDDPQHLAAFSALLQIPVETMTAFVASGPVEVAPHSFKPGWALTRAGRYAKLGLAAYGAYQQAVETYLHGQHYADPAQPGRKRLSASLEELTSLTQALNAQIAKINATQQPSGVLSYIRTLDPIDQRRREVAGGGQCEYGCGLDQSLRLPLVELEAFSLPPIPSLPPVDRVAKKLEALFRAVWHHNPEGAAALLDGLTAALRPATSHGA